MQKVYLAGGLRAEWRNHIKTELKGLTILCPVDLDDARAKDHSERLTLDEYGSWDLHFVRQSDIVFGYMERTNSSGIGLACEMGVAYGMGKTVILVLEKGSEHFDDSKLDFLRKVATISFSNLEDGISYLKLFGHEIGELPSECSPCPKVPYDVDDRCYSDPSS